VINGEEQPGGLVIIRAPSSSRDTIRLPPVSQPSSSQLSDSTPPFLANKPLSKKFRASAEPSARLAKGRVIPSVARTDDDTDEDVRIMTSEADDLRRQSRSHVETSDTALADISQTRSKPRSISHMDSTLPLEPRETPQIEKNRQLRGEGGYRRRSSVSMRGKRASTNFENTGVISKLLSRF